MFIISNLPNTDPATGNHDQGELVDDTTPGDGTGTPVREDWQSDITYGLYEIMKLAGLSPDDSVEGATQSQARNAMKAILNGASFQKFNRTTSYTILDNDFYRTIFVDTTAGDVTITLPLLANNIARKIRIIHARGGTNKVIIAPNAGDANTLTTDALAVIWLPKLNDYIDFENNDSTGAVLWQSVNERISCELELNTFIAYGTDTMIMRFSNAVTDFGNMFSHNHGSYGAANGLEITANRSGRYAFSFSSRLDAAGSVGLSLDSTQLTTVIQSITVSDRLGLQFAVGSGEYQSVTREKYVNKNGVLRPHTSGIANTGATAVTHFSALYLGN